MSDFQKIVLTSIFWLAVFALMIAFVVKFETIDRLETENAQLTEQLQVQNNGIAKTTQILNKGLENGKIDIDALRSIGWNIGAQPNKVDPQK
jgi:hypothetical protein